MTIRSVFDFIPTDLMEEPAPQSFLSSPPKHGKLYVMVGLPGSGKSTYIEHFLMPKGVIRVSFDLLHRMLTGKYYNHRSALYHTIENGIVLATIAMNHDIVVDRTCLDKKTRARFIDLGREANVAEIIAVEIVTPVPVSRQRNLSPERITAGHFVGGSVFEDLLARYEEVSLDEGFTSISKIDMAAIRLEGCNCG